MTDSDDLHRLDKAIALTPVTEGDPSVLRGETTPEYWNMVGPFGGSTAATLLHAVLMQPDVHGEPVSLTVNYAGPLGEGEFEIAVQAARTNRSNQHWTITQRQGGQVMTTASAVTAVRKDTWTDVEAEMPDAAAPEDVESAEPFPGINWVGSYDQRFVEGPIPNENSGEQETSRSTMWVRDNPARPADFYSIAAKSDTLYPRAFLRKGTYLPAGTVTITIHFLADAAELSSLGDDFVLATGYARRFGRSYYDQTSEIWSRDGTLLATAHQMVYFKI